MEIYWYKNLPSTHRYLTENIKNSSITSPCAIGVDFQSDGVGSRGNEWKGEEGNFYFSFCVDMKHLPKDLKIESISIYFSCLLKEVLCKLGSKIWIKWPNDFYIDRQKVGGVLTTKIKETIIGSIGLNIQHAPEPYACLDIQILPQDLARLFLKKLEENPSWKNVFSKFKIEFKNSLDFTFHLDGKKIALGNAELCEDGSIKIDNKKVYSLR